MLTQCIFRSYRRWTALSAPSLSAPSKLAMSPWSAHSAPLKLAQGVPKYPAISKARASARLDKRRPRTCEHWGGGVGFRIGPSGVRAGHPRASVWATFLPSSLRTLAGASAQFLRHGQARPLVCASPVRESVGRHLPRTCGLAYIWKRSEEPFLC